MTRKSVTAAVLILAALTATPFIAFAEAGPSAGPGGEPDYIGVRLEAGGLALSDRTDILDLEARPVHGAAGDVSPWDRKNPVVAMLLSCVLPGLGEIYAGETSRGRWFIASEAAIWAGYGTFKIQSGMREDDYKEYALIFAGVPEGSSSDYYSDIGEYPRNEGYQSYNEAIAREARSLYPDDLAAQQQYVAENGYYGDEAWDWGTLERFLEYRDLRHDARISERNAFYMTGLALLNRAISAVDSAWMVRRRNAGLSGEPAARLSVSPEFSEGGIGGRAALEVAF